MTEKLDMQTKDLTQVHIAQIGALFPNVVKEVKGEDGIVKLEIDFDVLRQELSDSLIDEKQERYQMTWPDKKKSILLANQSIRATLRPVPERSVNFETTKNIYIEGDNLDVLKVLRETYLGKVKMIYIDPPYNTGEDFIYDDDFSQSAEEYSIRSAQYDESGNRMVQNAETNGRFHTDWLNMIYPRLKLAKDFLSEDGVIFISIDEHEAANLKTICDEIFGSYNFISNIIWQSRTSISNDDEVSLNHNQTLIYARERSMVIFGGEEIDSSEYINPDNDPRGPWKLVPIDANHAGGDTVYPIQNPKTGIEYYPPNGRIWCYGKQTLDALMADGRIKFGLNDDSSPKRKLFLKERLEKGDVKTPSSILLDAGTTKDGTTEIMGLFSGEKVFDYPKPVSLLRRLIKYGAPNGGLIMDFFSGSGTTAHASFLEQLNKEYHFILVQIPEDLEEALKTAKPKSKQSLITAIKVCSSCGLEHVLTSVAEERIRRAGQKILDEAGILGDGLDVGFRVLRLDSTNMKDVYYNPLKAQQSLLLEDIDNIKSDRTHLDLLFQVMLDLGIELNTKIEEMEVDGKKVFKVGDNFLVACFASEVTDDVVREIAKFKPVYVVFRDASFKDDASNINCEQIIKAISPTTELKVL